MSPFTTRAPRDERSETVARPMPDDPPAIALAVLQKLIYYDASTSYYRDFALEADEIFIVDLEFCHGYCVYLLL